MLKKNERPIDNKRKRVNGKFIYLVTNLRFNRRDLAVQDQREERVKLHKKRKIGILCKVY